MQQNQPFHQFFSKKRRFAYHFLGVIGVFFAAGCAIVRPPEGGLKDNIAPKITTTSPLAGSKNVGNQHIEITFDEYIDPNVSANDIIVTPLPEIPPQVFVQGKTIHIKLKETLLPNTTYSVMLKPTVKDFHERNVIQESFQLAFSTGSNLDSAGIQGVVLDAVTSKPEKNCIVALFSPETVLDSNFTAIKPKYLTITDSTGNFLVSYVAPGNYFAAAYVDIDNSNTFNGGAEKIGLTERCLLKVTADSIPKITFFTQTWDTLAPSVSKVRWLGKSSVEVSFSEGLRKLPVIQSKDAFISPWISQNGKTIQIFTPHKSLGDSIFLSQITDSSNNFTSKVIYLPMTPPPDTFWMEQKPHPKKINAWVLRTNEYVPVDSFKTYCSCLDTAKQKISIQIESNQGTFEWMHPQNMNPEAQLKLILQPFSSKHIKIDTTQTLYCFPRFSENYGSITGKINTESDIIVYLSKEGNPIPIAKSTSAEFSFDLLEPGNYQLAVVSDDDRDGFRTMGGITPYRLPEKVWKVKDPVLVKANWETNLGVLKPVFAR